MDWSTPNPYVIDIRNVHVALPTALYVLLTSTGVSQDSRNGEVFVMEHPVMTVYRKPQERVVFWHERDANPFFHFMEGLGFLGGRYDVEFFATYAKQMAAYSDDGEVLPASYGRRWRSYFDFDQLPWAIKRLRNDPNDRRTVISMWDADVDSMKADNGSKDVPCNTNIFLNIRHNRLDMMVNCRSNDIFWGAYGSNAVHMSMLLEYLASSIGVSIGRYYQNSFNWHAYRGFYEKVMNERTGLYEGHSLRENIAKVPDGPAEAIWDPYVDSSFQRGNRPGGAVFHGLIPMMKRQEFDNRADYIAWDAELAIFLGGGINKHDGLTDPFLTRTAVPLRDAHKAYREQRYDDAFEIAHRIQADDWRVGCKDWLHRRRMDRERAAVDPGSNSNAA